MKSSSVNRYVQLGLVAVLLVLVNLLAWQFHARIDLTKEKRYSLAPVTEKLLDSLQHRLTIKIYLDGDLSPEVSRFRESVRTFVEELKVQGGADVDYTFTDPSGNEELQTQLARYGVPPIREVESENTSKTSVRLVFPAVVLTYNGNNEYVDLLKGERYSFNGRPNYLFAEQQLEYKFTAAIQRLMEPKRPIIGLLRGHGELPREQTREVIDEVLKFYKVVDINIRNGQAIPPPKTNLPEEVQKQIKGDGIAAVVVLGPDSAFTEREKYELDQYVMRGGKLLWLIDQQQLDRQSLVERGKTLTTLKDLNLDDLFAAWGVRFNYDMVQDVSCDRLYLVAGRDENGRPKFEALPWVYYPRLMVFPPHPITQNLDAVMMRYAGSIDTIAVPNSRRIPLLFTSPNTRSLKGNLLIDLESFFANPPAPEVFMNKGSKLTGVLVEGKFRSVFAGRKVPTDAFAPNEPSAVFTQVTPYPTRLIFLSDGDLPISHRMPYRDPAVPYDNKTLLLNCIDYLAGDQALANIRAKDVRLRKLDVDKVTKYSSRLQLLNVGLPILLIVLGGLGRMAWRKRKNEGTQL
jgi:ABC-2 type transport system permease protein